MPELLGLWSRLLFELFLFFIFFCFLILNQLVPTSSPNAYSHLNAHSSRWREKTARVATAVFPQTRLSTPHRLHPQRRRPRLPPPSRCPACHLRSRQQTARSPRNRTRSKFGPSPGACMKVGVSNMGFWWWVLGKLELYGVNRMLAKGNKLEEGALMVFLCIVHFLIISSTSEAGFGPSWVLSIKFLSILTMAEK